MAKTKWKIIPGGRVKRWKRSESESGCRWVKRVPPHWYRNHLNRRERQQIRKAISNGKAIASPYIHPRIAAWYW